YVAASGSVDIRASHAITASPVTAAPTAKQVTSSIFVDGSSVSLSSGPGGIALDLLESRASGGPFTALSLGTIALAGDYSSADTLNVVASGGTVNVSPATLSTTSQAKPTSADVGVETYGSPAQPN